MSELKFKVGDVVQHRNGRMQVVTGLSPRYAILGDHFAVELDGTAFDPENPIVRILGNVSDFDRLRQLDNRVTGFIAAQNEPMAIFSALLTMCPELPEELDEVYQELSEAMDALIGGPDA